MKIWELQALPASDTVYVVHGGQVLAGRILEIKPWATDPNEHWIHVLTTEAGSMARYPGEVWKSELEAMQYCLAWLASRMADLDLIIAQNQGCSAAVFAAKNKKRAAALNALSALLR